MSDSVNRLKELLFDGERATLSDLRRRIELLAESEQRQRAELGERVRELEVRLESERRALLTQLESLLARIGSDERFRASVAGVLDGAIRDAEPKRHDELVRALAPLVVRTFRTELRNSEHDIAEMLYPHTGRMVRSYVAQAMKDLVEQINRKLEATIAENSVMLRLRSLTTGRPMAELALAASQKPQVTDVFLVRRGSGELVARWPDKGAPTNSDIHLSGVIAAINDFALTAFQGEGGSIRSFELDNANFYLRASPAYLLVARVVGPELPGVESLIDEFLLTVMERYHGTLALPEPRRAAPGAELGALATDLDGRIGARHAEIVGLSRRGLSPLAMIAVLLAVPLGLYLGWRIWGDIETARIASSARQVVTSSADLRLFRPEVDVEWFGGAVKVGGLAPSEAARRTLIERLSAALPGTRIEDDLSVLPSLLSEVEPEIATVRQGLAGLEVELVRSAMARAVERAERKIDGALGDLDRIDQGAASDGQRQRLRETRASIQQAGEEIRLYRTLAGQSRGDSGTLQALAVPLHEAGQRLDRASAMLGQYLAGDRDPASSLPRLEAAPSDPLRSAEALSASAERLATLALAVGQVAMVRPPPPPPPPPAGPTPRQRLETWVRGHAIFFGASVDYRNPGQAEALLGELAVLMRETNAVVRVVGYTDERGGQARNTPLAQSRAEKVVSDLVARGVPAERLVAVGRPTGPDISALTGNNSPNRRVEFELGFEGETAP